MTHEHEWVASHNGAVHTCACGETRVHYIGAVALTGEGNK